MKFILLLTGFLVQSVFAGSFKTTNPERKRSSNEAMTEMVYKKFVKLQELIADEKYVEAKSGLIALTSKRLNGFEKASINHYLGWIESAQGNYDSASRYLQKAIDTDALPNQAHFSMMLQKIQMLAGADKYQEALNGLHKYYKVTDEISDSTFYLEASLYAQLEKYKQGIPPLKKANELSDKPKESWYFLLVNLHMHSSEYQQAAKVLETLITINPNKKTYWKLLSQVYFTLKKDKKALAVLVIADKNGMIPDEKDRLQLFKMYSFLDVPFKAGKVLEKGLNDGAIKPSFKRWDDLGNIWYAAQEMDKALIAYNEASKLATDGEIDFRRAYIYFGRDDWDSAKNALLSALEKGGLKEKKIGTANLLLGMAESEMNHTAEALKFLKVAVNYSNTRKNALQWIDHLKKQIQQAKQQVANEKAIADERQANKID